MGVNELKILSYKLRKNIIKMIAKASSGHPGGSFSIIDILTVMYFGEEVFKFDASNPKSENRDYFILSKAHAAPALYAVLGELGCINKGEFESLRQVDSLLQGHVTNKIPGIDTSGGSLGQGLSVACGIAMGLKIDGKDNKVFTALGDGEIQEGQIWEAAMTAGHYKLGNLTAILDRNRFQIDGSTSDIMMVDPLEDKWRSFNWEVITLDDGHDIEKITAAFKKAREVNDKPVIIIAETVKGKGVSFMENTEAWHGRAPNEEEFENALKELDEKIR